MLLTNVISHLNSEQIVGIFYEKELQLTGQKEFKIEKLIKTKIKDYMLNEKLMIILLTAGLMKKILLYKMSYFSESYTRSRNKVNNNLKETSLKNLL